MREDRIDASVGLYAENTSYWTPTLRSIAGLRYDAYRFKVNNARANGHKFSPKLSLIFGPWAQTEYFINYGAGFHNNDARGVTGTEAAPPLVGTRGAELVRRLRAALLRPAPATSTIPTRRVWRASRPRASAMCISTRSSRARCA
ncbi:MULTISPECIES: TonB-dependent receptor domain-containing protein [unclassified Duganella]|uniref:TonB-dependent receptor domain-containing protein n=1 Tax=unclassified Duganella TaxID=2636909 RepID=UPI0013EEA425|nr:MULTISPECIES: TonB-dependent receptor [unclassified Duganella]